MYEKTTFTVLTQGGGGTFNFPIGSFNEQPDYFSELQTVVGETLNDMAM